MQAMICFTPHEYNAYKRFTAREADEVHNFA